MRKRNHAVLIAALIALVGSASALARDIECSVRKGAKTVNGIRSIKFHKDDWQGSGKVTIVRDGLEPKTSVAIMGDELSWGESESLDPAGNYSVEESVTLQKTRDPKGVSSFALVKIRQTLSGPHCDGYHACDVSSVPVEKVSVECTDTFDAIKPNGPYHCNPDRPGDCE